MGLTDAVPPLCEVKQYQFKLLTAINTEAFINGAG